MTGIEFLNLDRKIMSAMDSHAKFFMGKPLSEICFEIQECISEIKKVLIEENLDEFQKETYLENLLYLHKNYLFFKKSWDKEVLGIEEK